MNNNFQQIIDTAQGTNIPFTFHEWSWSGDYNFSYEGNISQYVVFTEIIKITQSTPTGDVVITKELVDYETNGEIWIDVIFK